MYPRKALVVVLVLAGCVACGNAVGGHDSKTSEPKPALVKDTVFACKPEHPQTWQRLGRPPHRPICNLARHPLHPEQLLGENAEGWFTSSDEGETWCELDSDLPERGLVNSSVQLAASPAYPDKLFLATAFFSGFVLRRAANGSLISDVTPYSDVQVDPFDPTRLYATGPDGLVLSADAEHFEKVEVESKDPMFAFWDIALDPETSGLVYGITILGEFCRSVDAGVNWSCPKLPSGSAIQVLTVVSGDPSVIYLSKPGEPEFLRSTDQGESFEVATAPQDEFSLEQNALSPFAIEGSKEWGGACGMPVFDPRSADSFLLPTGIGLLTVEHDQIVDKRPNRLMPEGEFVSQFLRKATTDNVHFAAFKRGQLFLSSDAGENFDWTGSLNVKQVAFDQASPPGLFVEQESGTARGLLYSADFGESFETLQFDGLRALQLDELSPETLYAAANMGSIEAGDACWFVRSQDRGADWSCIWPPENDVRELCGGDYEPVNDGRCAVRSFATAPGDADTLFALTGGDLPSRIGKSTDGGHTWQRVGPELTTAAGTQATWALSPAAPQRIVISGAFPASTWRSEDAGESWTKLGEFFVSLQGSDAVTADTLYGLSYADAGASSLARSLDAGSTWTSIARDLPDCQKPSDYGFVLPSADQDTLYVGYCNDWFTAPSAVLR